jgi:hypothetical protein
MHGSKQSIREGFVMRGYRVVFLTATAFLLGATATGQAGDTLSPQEIKDTFGTGKPFIAEAASGTIVVLTLSPDGAARVTPKVKTKALTGIWRISDKGYCTTWGHADEKCYTVQKKRDGYDVINSRGAVIARWKLER